MAKKNMLQTLEEKNPLVAQFIKFYAFSMLVTLLQYLLQQYQLGQHRLPADSSLRGHLCVQLPRHGG